MDMSNANIDDESKENINETVTNSVDAIEESLDSEMGMSIDDSEIIQLFEQEPLWGNFASTNDQSSDLKIDRSTTTDQITETINDLNVMEIDHEDEPISDFGNLPEYPDFSMDDLPIFPEKFTSTLKDNTPEPKDNMPEPKDNTPEPKDSTPETKDKPLTPKEISSQLNDNATSDPPELLDDDLNKLEFSQSSDLFKSDDLFGGLLNKGNASPSTANVSPGLDDISVDDLPDLFSNIFSQLNDDPLNGSPTSSEQHSTTLNTGQQESSTGLKSRSLRQRNAIQLNPFTLEYARYKNMIGRAKLKTWSSTQHTNEDTQAIDTTLDDSIYSQYIPSTETSHIELPKRKSAPSNATTKKPKPIEKTYQQEELPSFEKYGLDRLILPPVEEESSTKKVKSNKVITFKKKRKSKHHRMTPRKIPRLQESHTKDIFAFEENPQSVFNISRSTTKSKENEKATEPINLSDHDDLQDISEENSELEEDELEPSSQLNFRRRKRRTVILDSDEEEEEEEFSSDDASSSSAPVKELTQAEIDKIYTFSSNIGSSHDKAKRLERKITDGDIVPVVADEFEYRDYRRPRAKLQDMIKKKDKALRGVLPASFFKLNQTQILEEDKSRTVKKKRPKPSKSTTATADTIPSSNDRTSPKPLEDIFAAFQSSDDEESVIVGDSNPVSIDDYVVREEKREIVYKKPNVSSKPKQRDTRVQQVLSLVEEPSNTPTPSENSKTQSSRPNHSRYPLHEAMEYNRIRRLYTHTAKKKSNNKQPRQKKSTSSNKKNRTSTTPSRKNNTHLPVNNKSYEPNQTEPNQTDSHLDGVEEIEDDDVFEGLDIFGDNDFREDTMFDSSDYEETSFDDLFDITDEGEREKQKDKVKHNNFVENASATYYYKYPSHDIPPTKINQDKANQGPKLPPLETITKKIRNAHGFALTHLKNTVYLHKNLLIPLLSSTRNQKEAYAHLKKDYEELEFFNTHFLWTDIVPKESDLVSSLFYHASKDIQSACTRWYEFDDDADLSGHDQFYTFVSICLGLWVPCLPEKDRHIMIDLLMAHTRNFAYLLQRLIREKPRNELPWKILTKLAIYVLDWTCRLYYLGVDPMDWSVIDYTQILFDFLVYSGHEEAKSKPCLVEAWVCLFQILSVTSRNNDFTFNEYVFIRQLKTSIKNTLNEAENPEVALKRNIELWAESLNYILDHNITS